jgi:glycosyltransferase involved in cell wall biosynthesis
VRCSFEGDADGLLTLQIVGLTMRFLFFAGGSYIGGMEIVTLTLMKELRAQGHDCLAIVSGWNDGRYPVKLDEARIPHQSLKLGRLHLRKPMWNLVGALNFPRAAGQLRHLVRDYRPDAVILGGVEFALIAMQVLPLQVPVVLHIHDIPSRHFGSWAGRYVLARTTGIVAVSNFIREHVLAVTRSPPTQTVHNGVPICQLPPKSPSSKVRIGIVGQLIARKRHDVIVAALELIEPELRKGIEMRIYGANTTDFARDVAQRIDRAELSDCFRWMGFFGSRDTIYGDLDIVVAPAVREPFGMTVLEAGAYGLPVVAARSGGFPEIVVDTVTGLLAAENDPRDFAEAIKKLLSSPDLRTTMGLRARQHVTTNFTSAKMAEDYCRAVQSFGIFNAARYRPAN